MERWFISRYNDSEVDRTVYVSSKEQKKAFDALEAGVYYRKAVGGIGNQLFSMVSAILLSELLNVPFVCMAPLEEISRS